MKAPEAMIDEIGNYLSLDRIGTAGQPTGEQFAAIQAAGYRVVINLALPTSINALPDEADRVTALGITYVHIPVIWESPTLQDLEEFFAVMERYREEKVFVHCALNMRVSAFIFLYRVIRLGVPPDEARGALLQIWQPDEVWRRFVDQALSHYGMLPR
jgi:protein tyrosine phosphatase (PTP) superfamily phosphohydrolase (DUF442 family)